MSRQITWRAPTSGVRLDTYVASEVESLSRTKARRLIDAGNVLLNGEVAKPSAIVSEGDQVEVSLPELQDAAVKAEALPLCVLYESDDIVVVDKPAGQLVHPTSHDRNGTLVNGLLWHYPEMNSVGPEERRGVVHRLDRDTSGLVAFGRSWRGLRSLQQQFREREIWKTYLTLVVGLLEQQRGVIDAPIGRHPRIRSRMAVVRQGGRPARTQYEVLEEFPGYSLLHAHPLTGRTHQIRVHFAALSHPVAGDPVYGRGSADLGLTRQFLHAVELRFVDPGKDQLVTVRSLLAPDLHQVLKKLKGELSFEQ